MLPLAAILLTSLAAPGGGGEKGHNADRDHNAGQQYAENDKFVRGAAEVWKCTFEPTGDEEYFGWPPGWTRPRGPGLPWYVQKLARCR